MNKKAVHNICKQLIRSAVAVVFPQLSQGFPGEFYTPPGCVHELWCVCVCARARDGVCGAAGTDVLCDQLLQSLPN